MHACTLHVRVYFIYIHRINQTGVIKVSDFGLTESVYASGYYRQDRSDAAVRLPYKWLPLESLQDSVFTEKSDVVRICTS